MHKLPEFVIYEKGSFINIHIPVPCNWTNGHSFKETQKQHNSKYTDPSKIRYVKQKE